MGHKLLSNQAGLDEIQIRIFFVFYTYVVSTQGHTVYSFIKNPLLAFICIFSIMSLIFYCITRHIFIQNRKFPSADLFRGAALTKPHLIISSHLLNYLLVTAGKKQNNHIHNLRNNNPLIYTNTKTRRAISRGIFPAFSYAILNDDYPPPFALSKKRLCVRK